MLSQLFSQITSPSESNFAKTVVTISGLYIQPAKAYPPLFRTVLLVIDVSYLLDQSESGWLKAVMVVIETTKIEINSFVLG